MEEQLFLNFGINFNLREPKSNKPTLIYAVVSYRSQQFKVSTNTKVVPTQWDVKRQLCTIGRGLTRLDNRNNLIANQRIKDILVAFTDFKFTLYNSVNIDNVDIKSLLYSIIEPHIKRRKAINHDKPTIVLLRSIDNLEIKESSKKQYHNMIKLFQSWLKDSGIKDSWNNITKYNIEAFRGYLIDNSYLVITINITISVLIKRLKSIDIIDNWNFDNTRISKIEPLRGMLSKEDTSEEEIALSHEDLDILYQFNDLTERQIEVRDLFVLQANCGQRISDLSKLFDVDITDKMDTIIIQQQKTNAKAYIPITPIIREILIRYKNGFRHINLNSEHYRVRVNRELKEVCKKIKRFNVITTFKKQKGKEVVSIDLQIYKRIHTHTARHSFVTNWIRDGKDKNTLILISGHSDLNMINNVYQHLNDTDKCNLLKRASKPKTTTKKSKPKR